MFSLILQELKFRRNAVFWWGIGLCFFPIVYLGIYPQVAEEMQNLADLEIYKAMGISLGTLEDWIGSIIILFIPLILSIFVIINGTGTLAGEEEDGRLEMLVTLPKPRWQILTAKALALSVASFIIIVIVSIASGLVFISISGQVESELQPEKMILSVLYVWPFVFSMAMISVFLAVFCARRIYASLISAVVLIVSYFGHNLAGSTSALEPIEPFFLFTYLDSTAKGVLEGQASGDVITLLLIGLVAFMLALFFFEHRKLTVGVWPWQRGRLKKK